MPKTFNDLVELMDRLRSPGGCPWDREQTYATLAPMLLEEAYEAFDALEEARQGRPDDLREELGDLLFQITFFARVAKERGEFTIDDVIDEKGTTGLYIQYAYARVQSIFRKAVTTSRRSMNSGAVSRAWSGSNALGSPISPSIWM